MGTLRRDDDPSRLPLPARAVIGRAPTCGLVIDDRSVSREHAMLAWNGEHWELWDLGSANGTWVDQRRLSPGARQPLALGSRVQFGQSPAWELVTADGPQPLAYGAEGTLSGLGGLLELPSASEGQAVVLCGFDGTWLLDLAGDVRPVFSGDVVEVDGRSWRLALPQSVPSTQTGDLTRFRATVSRDEEHVEITIDEGGRTVDLGARSHHYLLLTLARVRAADAQNPALPEAERGWIHRERLEQMLRQSDLYVNVLVFRARKQATEAGLACAPWLVERRGTTGQVRLGISEIEITTRGG